MQTDSFYCRQNHNEPHRADQYQFIAWQRSIWWGFIHFWYHLLVDNVQSECKQTLCIRPCHVNAAKSKTRMRRWSRQFQWRQFGDQPNFVNHIV